jgi:hypothetical protein
LKTFSAFISIFLSLFQANSSPLAVIVLNTSSWNAGRPPMDWQVKVNHGRPEFDVCQDNSVPCLHLKSSSASFGLEHKVDVQPAQTPYLTWRWKVTQLPAGGDFRHSTTDDQAAQLLVAFEDNRVLTYIWDSSAPKGTAERSASIPFVHIFAVVCESGAADVNRWLTETRNVAADFQRAYGRTAPRVKGLRLQINSQHTGTVAESYFGEVAFRSTPE